MQPTPLHAPQPAALQQALQRKETEARKLALQRKQVLKRQQQQQPLQVQLKQQQRPQQQQSLQQQQQIFRVQQQQQYLYRLNLEKSQRQEFHEWKSQAALEDWSWWTPAKDWRFKAWDATEEVRESGGIDASWELHAPELDGTAWNDVVWRQFTDKWGKPYYYNAMTRRSQWKSPEDYTLPGYGLLHSFDPPGGAAPSRPGLEQAPPPPDACYFAGGHPALPQHNNFTLGLHRCQADPFCPACLQTVARRTSASFSGTLTCCHPKTCKVSPSCARYLATQLV